MKFTKSFILILCLIFSLSLSMASAVDLNDTQASDIDDASPSQSFQNEVLSGSPSSYYVDNDLGEDVNDGKSWESPVKTFNKALDIAEANDTIYLSDGVYSGLENTKLTIDKSVSIIGSSDTAFDGLYSNYLFLISDNVDVTFKNIKFVNGYKTDFDSDLIDDYDLEGIYGGALDIQNAKVTIDNCYFKYNMANYQSSATESAYGGAISNFGDLTISNTIFDGNAVGAGYDIYGYGGAIYNKGRMVINNSYFNDSRGNTYSYGGAVYNDGIMIINNTIITNSYCWEESKGSAIFNNGNLTLWNSIIENNTIERTDFNYIYGNIFNSGKLIAVGNIFRNNTAYYKQPNSQYFGSPTIYNVGDLDLSYNAFIDNVGFNGIFNDIYLTGGTVVNIDNNWWNTNNNPSELNKVNYDVANSWIVLDLSPKYSSVRINESVDIRVSWKLSNGGTFDFSKFPIFNVTIIDETVVISQLDNGYVDFVFNNTINGGSYTIEAVVNSFSTQAIVDVGKTNTFVNVSLNATEISSFESVRADIYLYDENLENLTDKVTVYLNSKYYAVDIVEGHGNITFSDLIPNDYTLKVIYEGDNLFSKSNNETNFTVEKMPVTLIIFPIEDIKASDDVNLTINLTGYKTEAMAHLYINGAYKQPIYLNSGVTTFNLNYFAKGQYNITVMLLESTYYMPANASVFFNVEISSVSLNVSAEDIYAGSPAVITVEASKENFNGQAILSVNGVNSTVSLNGKFSEITISSLSNGTYDVELIFEGNDRFTKANASTSFNVYKRISSLNVTIEKNNLTGTITVKTNSAKCSGKIEMYVNQRYYVKSLNNGAAIFDVEFDKGTNYIYVFYNGDFTFEGSTWNSTIGNAENYFLVGTNVICFEHNEFNYTVGLYEENGIAMPYQTVTIGFENKTYNINTNSRGIAVFTLNLNEGRYSINATYKNVTVTNILSINPIIFNLTSNDISYGETEQVIVEFGGNISGNVYLEFSDKTFIQEIKDSKAIFNLTGLNAGNYSFNAYYSNEFFNSTKINDTFRVRKADSEMHIEIIDMEVDKAGNITVTFSDGTAGYVDFIVDNATYQRDITDSKVILYLYGLAQGYHDLEVIYGGNENYDNASHKTRFTVKCLKTDLEIIVGDNAYYGEELEITTKVNANATGNITFKIANISKTCEIQDGLAIWKVRGIDVGTYGISARYDSDCLFINQHNETSINILKANSTIELYTIDVYLDENIRIYARLSPNATGNVTYSMPGYYSPRTRTISDSASSWYISPLKSGSYTVLATYNGDKNYYPSNTTFILSVTQRKSVLNVEISDVTKNERVTAIVRLTTDNGDGISGNVMLKIGESTHNVIVKNGKGSFVLGKMNVGSYNYLATYEGNEEFSKSSDEGSFKVFETLIATQLETNNITKYVGGPERLVVTLSQFDGKAISNAAINIHINNKDYALITNDEGKASIELNLKKGTYGAEITFNETERYFASSVNMTVNVLSTIESIDVVKLYGSGTQYFAIFKDFTGKALGNTSVTFKIGSKSYTFNTAPNGIARININLSPGTYTITATNPVTGEIVKNSIRVFAYIMGNKDVTKYFGANKNYKVRVYDDNGKAVGAGKVVQFTINGKKYKVKTDKNGYATCKLNFNPKTYVITASYNKFKVSNKVVIKPVLTTKITSSKKTKKTKFTAKLVNAKGKPVKGKKITFKINGKKYAAKTNKKGFASISIKLKLKKGTYKIYTIYGKSKVTNTIKVK